MKTNSYNLTHPQKRILQLETLYPESSALNIMGYIILNSEIDKDLLDEAINIYIKNNDSLQTRIITESKGFKVNYSDYKERRIPRVSFSTDQEFTEWLDNEIKTPFTFIDSELFKYFIFTDSNGDTGFVIKYHHIISDAWTTVNSVNKIISNYSELVSEERIPEIKDNKIYSYRNYPQYEEEYLGSKRYLKDKEYWEKRLTGCKPNNYFRKNDDISCLEARRIKKVLPKDLYASVISFCEENNITLYSFLFANIYLVMTEISGDRDLVIGTNLLNRTSAAEKRMSGMFVSTMAFRNTISPGITYIEYLKKTGRNIIDDMKHQKFPFNELKLSDEDISFSKIYDVLFSFQNAELDKSCEGIKYVADWYFNKTSFNTLSIHTNNRGKEDSITIDYDYQTMHYSPGEVDRIHELIVNTINNGIKNPEADIFSVNGLSEDEKHKILYEFSMCPEKGNYSLSNEMDFSSLIGKIMEIAENNKDKTAVIDTKSEYSYGKIIEDSGKIQAFLKNRNIGRGDFIPLIMDRSYNFIISVIGVLRAGAAYVPIDLSIPSARRRYILEHCGAQTILYNSCIPEKEEVDKAMYFNVSEIISCFYEEKQEPIKVTCSDSAYMIYTSGTTGNPKGVLLSHGNLYNYISWAAGIYPEGGRANMPLFTSISFDLTVTSIFMPLLTGSCIKIYSENNVRDTLEEIFNDDAIDIIKLTPSHLTITNTFTRFSRNLKSFILGGEELKGLLALTVSERYDHEVSIYNEYGPTETTVGCMIYKFSPFDPVDKGVLIGKPIDGTSIFILDEKLNIKPWGCPGEICVAGRGVSIGYYKNQELTDEKFVLNPFPGEGLLYRTGDRGMFLSSGDVEYSGRFDSQVKIKGNRIELSEIENTSGSFPGISNTLVSVIEKKNEDTYLGLYYTSGSEIRLQELKNFLKEKLPFYMVPVYYRRVHEIPINANGKTDARLLPPFDESDLLRTDYIKPQTKSEIKLAKIWSEILNIEKIGTEDNFFDLGGYSLKAIELVNRINEETGWDLKLQDIFAGPTIKSIVKLSEGQKEIERFTGSDKKLSSAEMSSTQKGLYAEWIKDNESMAYNMPFCLKFTKKPDFKKLESSFQCLTETYSSLCTNFYAEGGKLIQKLNMERKFSLQRINISKNEEDLKEILLSLVRPFNLENDLLIRGILLEGNKTDYLFIDMHHIISDGISSRIYLDSLFSIYRGEEINEPEVSYLDYSKWHNSLCESEEFKKQEMFWNEKLRNFTELEVPSDRDENNMKSSEFSSVSIKSGKKLISLSEQFTKDTGITPFMLYFGAYQLFLMKFTGREGFVTGIPYHGRNRKEFENATGMFVNIIPVIGYIQEGSNVTEYFRNVRNTLLDCFANSDIPFERISSNIKKITGSEIPLFKTMFVMNESSDGIYNLGDTEAEIADIDLNREKYDFSMQINDKDKETEFKISYNASLYDKENMERLLDYYLKILTEVTENPLKPLEEISLKDLNPEKYSQAKEPYFKNLTIGEVFEKRVSEFHSRTALVFNGEKMTYQILNENVNRFTCCLVEKGVGKGDIVALLMDKSMEMITAILGIIKSGAAYLPIDTYLPPSRMNSIFSDSQAAFIVSHEKFRSFIPDDKYIDFAGINLQEYPSENPSVKIQPEDPAYVIYTSGSTGNPKGVVLKHSNACAVAGDRNLIGMGPEDKVLQLCNYAFDVSVGEIFCTLLNGGELHIQDKNAVYNLLSLSKYIIENKITFIFTTTAVFNLITEICPECLVNLRRISVGGEKASAFKFGKGFEYTGPGVLINAYGPTETTVLSTGYIYDGSSGDGSSGRIPIGKPLESYICAVIGSDNMPVPEGAVGELAIGGSGVASGYLNRPELNREKFIDVPWSRAGKFYKTGDLARVLPDGNIDFIRRNDGQVKIRGYRIELEEITAKVLKIPGVKNALTKISTEGQRILSYAVCEADTAKGIAKNIEEELSAELPSYMCPDEIIILDEFPLTSNGKINLKILPENAVSEVHIKDLNDNPEELNISEEKSFLNNEEKTGYKNSCEDADINELQDGVLNVIKEVLGNENINVSKGFFESGGDSIKAIQIISLLKKKNILIESSHLMNSRNIGEILSKAYRGKRTFSQEIFTGSCALPPVAMEFLEENGNISGGLTQEVVLEYRAEIDEEILKKALGVITDHHDSLRFTLIPGENPYLEAKINGPDKFFFSSYSFKDIPELNEKVSEEAFINKVIAEKRNNLDPLKGPIFGALNFKGKDRNHLSLICHHIGVDGVSWRIITEDLNNILRNLLDGKVPEIEDKTSLYSDWINSHKDYIQSFKFTKASEYWTEILSKGKKASAFTEKYINKNMRTVKQTNWEISEEDTEKLLTAANIPYGTSTNELILAAVYKTTAEIFGTHDLFILAEGHGREETDEKTDISRTTGWFTSVYPLLFTSGSEKNGSAVLPPDIKSILINTKDNFRRIPNRGFDYQFVKLSMQEVKEDSNKPDTEILPFISFNYLGDVEQKKETLLKKSDLIIDDNLKCGICTKSPLDIRCIVDGKKLKTLIFYNSETVGTDSAEKFAGAFSENIRDIIDFCCGMKEKVITVTDFNDDTLNDDDLESILNIFA